MNAAVEAVKLQAKNELEVPHLIIHLIIFSAVHLPCSCSAVAVSHLAIQLNALSKYADSCLLGQLLERETQDILSVAEEELELEHEKLQAKEFEVREYHARLCATRDIFFLRNEHLFTLVVQRNILIDFVLLWREALAQAAAYRAHWEFLMRILRERGRRKLQHGLLVEYWKSRCAAGKTRLQEPDKSDRKVLKENVEQNR